MRLKMQQSELRLSSRENGGILLWTVVVIAILSIFATEALRVVSGRFRAAMQAATWQESLVASESGIDLAVIELRKSLYPAPNHAWEGWNDIPGNGVISHGLSTIPNAGLAGTPMTIEVNVDAPAQLIDPSNGWQYYRIRTLGTMPLTGPAQVAFSRQDNRLRKLTLRVQVHSPGRTGHTRADSRCGAQTRYRQARPC